MKCSVRVWSTTFFLCLLLASSAHAAGFILTINVVGSGSVNRDPTNSVYPSGANVILTAISNDPSWYFSNWSGDATGTDNPLNETMDSDKVITATFLQFPSYTLALATNGQGTISLNPPGGIYLSNSAVTVTATPAAGWVFDSWSGSTNGNTNPLSFTMNMNNSLTGTFAQLPAFDSEPQGVTNLAGSTISFTSHAVGTAPQEYQWFFTGGSLASATNTTLTLTNIQSTNTGKYFTVATNNYGSATSDVVALVITNFIGTTNVVNSPDEASLRAAIQIGGWVSLGFNGTVTITNTINITNNVILDGSGVSATISGGNAARLFYVAPGASLSVTNLTLANGMMSVNGGLILTNGVGIGAPADAGAIYNDHGTVTLTVCTVTNNSAQALSVGGMARGGAIFNNGGNVSLFQTSISNNSALGGGINGGASLNGTNFGLGGAIYNNSGTVVLMGCNISSNLCQGLNTMTTVSNIAYNMNGIPLPPIPQTASGNGVTMGGAVYQASGSLTITDSRLAFNLALGSQGAPTGPNYSWVNGSPAFGGALAVTGGNVPIDHSQFFANTAIGGDAGYHTTASPAFGGAVYSAAALSVGDSSFFGNQALAGNNSEAPNSPGWMGVNGCGGGIYNGGIAVLNRCAVCSNYVQGGSGVAYPGAYVNGGNGLGGGIFNASQISATNCTIALNSIVGGNGEVDNGGVATNGQAIGGGVFNNTNAAFIAMNLTIASNNCSSPPALYLTTNGIAAGSQIANTNGTLRLHNSIIAYGGTNGNSFGVITDDGFNISSDGTAQLFGGSSYNYTDPKLGPLDYYTGPTLCMALLPISPAIDFGDSSGAPATDQRGYPRPNGDGVDIGAYEFYYPNQTVVPRMNLAATANGVALDFTAFPTNLYRLQTSTNLSSWIDLETNGPFSSVTNLCRQFSAPGSDHRFFRLLLQ